MALYYFENGKMTYIEKYDPLPDYDRLRRNCDKSRKKYRQRMSESYPRGWW